MQCRISFLSHPPLGTRTARTGIGTNCVQRSRSTGADGDGGVGGGGCEIFGVAGSFNTDCKLDTTQSTCGSVPIFFPLDVGAWQCDALYAQRRRKRSTQHTCDASLLSCVITDAADLRTPAKSALGASSRLHKCASHEVTPSPSCIRLLVALGSQESQKLLMRLHPVRLCLS